jgi:hypothetical protein
MKVELKKVPIEDLRHAILTIDLDKVNGHNIAEFLKTWDVIRPELIWCNANEKLQSKDQQIKDL